jgi:hypothetical protein
VPFGDVWIFSAQAQWKDTFACRDKLGYSDPVAGDENFFAFQNIVQKLGEVGFGVVDVICRHNLSLVQLWD